jgi:hypothetical protein
MYRLRDPIPTGNKDANQHLVQVQYQCCGLLSIDIGSTSSWLSRLPPTVTLQSLSRPTIPFLQLVPDPHDIPVKDGARMSRQWRGNGANAHSVRTTS